MFFATMGVSPGEFWAWMFDLVRGIVSLITSLDFGRRHAHFPARL
jgi:hypothetical protein